MKHPFSWLVSNYSHTNFGLFLIRLGLGICMMVFHGWGKISGGPETWRKVGGGMENLGVTVVPVFWGFMAAFSEFFAAALVVLGVFFRPATLLLAFTMMVAVLQHLNMPPDSPRAGWGGASHALKLFVVFLGLFFSGPGKIRFGKM